MVMKLTLFATALLGALATGAVAKDLPSPSDSDAARITISCYRGLVKTIAWDRANAVFLDDLTLEELRALRISQRFQSRPSIFNGKFGIPTLKEGWIISF